MVCAGRSESGEVVRGVHCDAEEGEDELGMVSDFVWSGSGFATYQRVEG